MQGQQCGQGRNWGRGRERGVVRPAPTAAQNIILCHQFDLIVAQPTSELYHRCPTVAPHSAAIDTLAWSSATRRLAAGQQLLHMKGEQTFSCLVLRACCTYPTMHNLTHLQPCTIYIYICVRACVCVSLYSYLLVYVISSKRNNRTT